MCVCGLINIYSRQEHQRVVAGELPLPPLPPLPPLLPLTFSLQPQVLQLEYLYADALSTCSSCFPSFTLVPLLPLPRTLPLSLSPPPLSLSLPLSLFLSRFVHIIYAHCKNLSPPERLLHICFCGFSLTAQHNPTPCAPQPRPPCRPSPLFNPTLTESIGVSGFCYDCRGFWL